MSNLATHLTKLESVIVSTLRRPASLCDKSCCVGAFLVEINAYTLSFEIIKTVAPSLGELMQVVRG